MEELIRENFSYLMDHIEIRSSPLLDLLYQKGAINKYLFEDIEYEHRTHHGKMRTLLRGLQRGPDKNLELLREALLETEHEHVIEKCAKYFEGFVPQGEEDSTVERRMDEVVEKMSDKELKCIAEGLGNEWYALGIELGLTKSKLEQLESASPRQPMRRNHEMLVVWRDGNKESKEEQVAILQAALVENNRQDLADDVP